MKLCQYEWFSVFFLPDCTTSICEVSTLPTLSQRATLDNIFNYNQTLDQFQISNVGYIMFDEFNMNTSKIVDIFVFTMMSWKKTCFLLKLYRWMVDLSPFCFPYIGNWVLLRDLVYLSCIYGVFRHEIGK